MRQGDKFENIGRVLCEEDSYSLQKCRIDNENYLEKETVRVSGVSGPWSNEGSRVNEHQGTLSITEPETCVIMHSNDYEMSILQCK